MDADSLIPPEEASGLLCGWVLEEKDEPSHLWPAQPTGGAYISLCLLAGTLSIAEIRHRKPGEPICERCLECLMD